VFSIVEFRAAALDEGIPGVSPSHMLRLILMTFSVPMIPYLFLFLSLRDEEVRASISSLPLEFATRPFRKMIAWVHARRHPKLLHH
jgi:hypothetical protein